MSKKNTSLRNDLQYKRDRQRVKRKKAFGIVKVSVATLIAAFFAILFLTPIILTITNSFMASSEISSNYGSVFATNALFIEFFGLGGAVAWTVHDDVGAHELGVVLVGRDHVHLESALGRLQGQCADDVVGLEARHLEQGNAVGADNLLDDGHG